MSEKLLKFDEKSCIDNCTFTFGWLLKSLWENDKKFRERHEKNEIKYITASDISDGRGVASFVLRCILIFSDIDETYTTVLKVPGMQVFKEVQQNLNDDIDYINDTLINRFNAAHQKECNFYNQIALLINAPIPEVYKTEDWIIDEKEGCIHMEDLSQKGKTLTYFETVNLNQVKNFVQNLAKMHKNILASDSKIWKGKFVESQDFFMYYFDILEEQIDPFLNDCKREAEFIPLFEKFKKLRTNRKFLVYAQTQAFHDLGISSVIVHGDIHPGNLLWKVNSNGDIENELEALLDWQLMHEGSPMADLARFMTHCPNGVVRRQAETFIIEYYLECLLSEFDGDETKVPYSIDQLRKAYNYSFTIQTFFTVPMVSFFYAASKDRIKNDGIKKAMFEAGVMKALHAYQDLEKIYEEEMKDVFEKYGL